MELYADILLPLKGGPFTYSVPDALAGELQTGSAVAVPLGQRKIQMGIVWRLHRDKPGFRTRPVDKVLPGGPLADSRQMEMWEWVAGYYMSSLGDVMRFALPASLKPSGMSGAEFSKDEYRPETIRYIALHGNVADVEGLNEISDGLVRRSKAQYALLMRFLEAAGDDVFSAEVSRERLNPDSVILKKLIDKNILRIIERQASAESRENPAGSSFSLPELTAPQLRARAEIEASFSSGHHCTLLHGVTGSGKTEIYMHLIAAELKRGRSVLYLMPEISMTSQLVARIRAVFSSCVTVYHSMISDRRRAEAYLKMKAGKRPQLVLGVRSSIFLPIPDVGLIVVDEEHDASYKQSDNSPRYHARDCAVYMANKWGAGCLLASATPSIESYTNALGGKYGLVTLNERYGEAELPRITISDTIKAVKRGERRSHFNKILQDKIASALEAGRQVMLFQNRRGFAPYIECAHCGWTAQCPRCSVTLSYHKQDRKMRCHTCGFSSVPPQKCPKCGSAELNPQGFGTEKLEEELMRLFPDARVARLDRDTATTQRRYEKIVSDFEAGRTDILVGTQMITKGFDFPGLSLVGILNADNLLNYPDFRAGERAYQIMTQVAGRAGRADDKGEVIIQTSQPGHPIILQVRDLDYTGMVTDQLAERAAFGYPPYGRIITVSLKHYKKELVGEGAAKLAANMRGVFGERVYGPHAPVIEKISNENYLVILLKVENGRSYSKVKAILATMIEELNNDSLYRNITVACNVDPQ